MTLISKLAISLFISVTSIFVLHKPPTPTPAETKPAPITVWQGLEPASPLPTTTLATTPITQPDAFNATDPNGGSAGAMQINYFWCKPSRYYANGYLQAYGLIRTCDDLFDLEDNLRSALAIYRYSNGWRAWSL